MKKKIKKIITVALCCVLLTNSILYATGREYRVHAAAFAIPAGSIAWKIIGSLFVVVMGYCIADSVSEKVEVDLNEMASEGLTKEEAYDSLVAEGPQWYLEEETVFDLLDNMYGTGAFLATPALNTFVGAYINQSEDDNPVTILEEYFGTTLVNGEDSSYMTSLGDSKLMSYSTAAGSNGLFLTREALIQLMTDIEVALNAYVELDVEQSINRALVTDINADLTAESYIDFNNAYVNRYTYRPAVPAIPDITTSECPDQEYIIFHCNYSINYEDTWLWCLTWAEPEGYDLSEYLRATSVYTLEGRNAGIQSPAFYFDTCSVDSYPHPSGLHTEDIIAAGVNVNMYGLKDGEWYLHSDFTSSVTPNEWYNYGYKHFDFGALSYNSVPLPARFHTGYDEYIFVKEFYPVYTIDGMRSNTDVLADESDAVTVPIGLSADYILVDTNTGVATIGAVNEVIRENVITGVQENEWEKTVTTVIDLTNEEAVADIADESDKVVADAIDTVTTITPSITPTIPSGGNYSGYIMDDGIVSKFPFCIPFDLIATIQLLASDPVVPRWEIPFKFESLGIDEVIVIDLAPFETVAAICRWCETVAFIIFLVLQTRKLISG